MRKIPLALTIGLVSYLLTFPATNATAGIITTVAGGGPDNIPADSANLPYTGEPVADSSGNIYVASLGLNRVFRIDTSGTITVVAGDGLSGFNGDGIPAPKARLGGPKGIAFDPSGNLVIADFQNSRIRRVNAGIITTIAGNGIAGIGGDGGPATLANLNFPLDLAIDAAGNIYVADSFNFRVRKVDAATGVISTLAGNGINAFSGDGGPAASASLGFVTGVALDGAGRLLIADSSNHRIRSVDLSTGVITTFVGNGSPGYNGDNIPRLAASLFGPQDLSVDAAGNLFIADPGNQRVRRVDASTGLVTTWVGNGVQGFNGDGLFRTDTTLSSPDGVAFTAGGVLLVSDTFNHRLRRVDAGSGVVSTVAGNGTLGFAGDGYLATGASLYGPPVVAANPTGGFFVLDQINERIRRVAGGTGTIETIAIFDDSPCFSGFQLSTPSMVADASGNLYFTDTSFGIVCRWDASTGVSTIVAGGGSSEDDGVPATDALLNAIGLALDAAGNLYISDQGPLIRIRKVDAASHLISTVAGTGNFGFSPDGTPALQADLYDPRALALEPDGSLLFVEYQVSVVRRVDASTGILTTIAGNEFATVLGDGGPATDAMLAHPTDIAVDPAGNLYIADVQNNRVRRVDAASQIITTVAGGDVPDFSGDGGPSVNAALYFPSSVSVDSAGNLLIADTWNSRIRSVSGEGGPGGPQLILDPSTLWPPNHRMVPVTATLIIPESCELPDTLLTSLISDEPDDLPGGGDGTTVDDIQGAGFGTADLEFSLRAERQSQGAGRRYTVTYEVTCASGEVITFQGTVLVPHDHQGVTEPLTLSVESQAGGTYIGWNEVPGAVSYNVVRGDGERLHEAGDAIVLGPLACVQGDSAGTDTGSNLDASLPAAGKLFFYLVEYTNSSGVRSSYGTETLTKPRVKSSGGCS